jgi:hypothetical protein
MCGEEIQFFEIRTSYFEFLPSQHPEFQTAVVRGGRLEFNSMHAVCHPILAYRGGGGGGEGKRLNITVH